MDTLLAASALVGGATGWVVYLRWKDRHRPEPLGWMLLAVAAGGLAVGAALAGYRLFDSLGARASWGALAGPLPGALAVALAIGLAEEGAKLLPVIAIAHLSRHFDEMLDGAVYAGAAAIGFAGAETASLVMLGEPLSPAFAARAAVAPITHALFAIPAGLGLAAWRLAGRPALFALGAAGSVATHGLYDLLLARPGGQPAAAALAGALFLGFLWMARRRAPRTRVSAAAAGRGSAGGAPGTAGRRGAAARAADS